jgi:hypothetical protein
MYNKTIIEFGFCDMQNYQGLGKRYQPRLRIIPHITKTSSNTQKPTSNYYLFLISADLGLWFGQPITELVTELCTSLKHECDAEVWDTFFTWLNNL